VFLILLVVFIAQNTAKASIHFLGFNGHLPLGLTILISAIIGLLIAAVLGSIRIMQLRRALNATRHPTSESSDNGERDPTSRQPANVEAPQAPDVAWPVNVGVPRHAVRPRTATHACPRQRR